MVEMSQPGSGPSRRDFLAACGAAAGASLAGGLAAAGSPSPAEKLAIDGGEPVRQAALSARPPGPQYYDDEERKELLDVLESRSPFRWWGFGGRPPKVLEFEKEYAAFVGTKFALGVT
jgi:hypothetical protein